MFRDIPGFFGYKIDTQGNVISYVRQAPKFKTEESHPIKQNRLNGSYWTVHLKGERGMERVLVHRLVLLTYVGPCPQGHEGAHLDGNINNNNLTNLQWVTSTENCEHKRIHNTRTIKITDDDVLKIRELYSSGITTYVELSSVYKISRAHIGRIIRNERRVIPCI